MFIKQLIYRLKRVYHLLKTGFLRGLPAQIKYSFPANKIKIITITGTDGKTSSSTLLYHVLKTAGKKVALLTTVAAYIGDQEIDTGFHVTSPDPRQVQKFISDMVDQGIEYLILEVTSHGAYQYRTWGIKPMLAGVTNITHEHLDYHLTYENYVEAKTMILKKSPHVFYNNDDQSAVFIRKELRDSKTKLHPYSSSDRIYNKVIAAIKTRFPEDYNQMNARLVYALAKKLDIDNSAFIKAITSFAGVPGRMQEIKNKKGFRVFVDFAHTPNALREALTALRKNLKGKSASRRRKLIAVYGSAGLRDYTKRPMMGQAGVDLADIVILTAEDPRTEDVWSIIRQMKENLKTGHNKIISIADRKRAIRYALDIAQKGDIVGIFGKGHEKSMCFGTKEMPWSDVETVKEILATKN